MAGGSVRPRSVRKGKTGFPPPGTPRGQWWSPAIMGGLLLLSGVGFGISTSGSPDGQSRQASESPDSCRTTDEAIVPGGRCPRVIYVWSDGMPLSVLGIDEARRAATDLGLPFTAVNESVLFGAEPNHNSIEASRSAIVRAGATLHFPSFVLIEGQEPYGPAVLGYRRSEGYDLVLGPRLEDLNAALPQASAPLGVPGEVLSYPIRVLWRKAMDPTPGNFFRRVPGTRFISYDQQGRVYLYHLEDGHGYVGPGFIDFVPTPDGAWFVTPSPRNGLEFYPTEAVLNEALLGRGAQVKPFFTDPEMDDQYPSVGIIARDPMRTDYRVLISWFDGLAVRDYAATREQNGRLAFTPTSPKKDR